MRKSSSLMSLSRLSHPGAVLEQIMRQSRASPAKLRRCKVCQDVTKSMKPNLLNTALDENTATVREMTS